MHLAPDRSISLLAKTLIGLTLFFIALLVISEVWRGPLSEGNARQLVGPVAFTRGLPVYPSQPGAALISGIEGPVYLAMFAPAALGPTPVAAVQIGVGIALLLFFVPAFVLLAQLGKLWTILSMVFATLCLYSEGLKVSSTTIQAEAPALGFSALAIAFLFRSLERNRISSTLLSALCAALAVSAKIALSPLLLAIPLYLFLTGNSRRAVQATAALVVALAVIQGMSVWYFGVESSLASLRWGTFKASDEIFKNNFWLLAILVVSFGSLWQAEKRGTFLAKLESILETPWVALFFFAVCLLPGATNAQSLFDYYLMLAIVAWLGDLLSRWDKRRAEGALNVALVLSSLALIPTVYASLLSPPNFATSPLKQSYEYAMEHREETYFPEFPLSTLYSDGKVYHSGVAAAAMEARGVKLSLDDFQLHTPRNIQYVAFQAKPDLYVIEHMPDFIFPVRLPELLTWLVFTKQEGSAHAAASKTDLGISPNPIF